MGTVDLNYGPLMHHLQASTNQELNRQIRWPPVSNLNRIFGTKVDMLIGTHYGSCRHKLGYSGRCVDQSESSKQKTCMPKITLTDRADSNSCGTSVKLTSAAADNNFFFFFQHIYTG